MKNTILGAAGLVSGALFVFIGIFYIVRNKVRGEKILDGRIIDIDLEHKALIIRYRISKNNYEDIAFYKHCCFLPGAEMPPIGLKVTVTVKKDDLYAPVSVLIMRNYGRGSGNKRYLNHSRTIMLVSWLALSLLFIFSGIIALIS